MFSFRLILSSANLKTSKFLASQGRTKAFIVRTMSSLPEYESLKLNRTREFVVEVCLNRPEKRNSLNLQTWKDVASCFEHLHTDPDCRVVVLSGAGKTFCAGLDFGGMTDLMSMVTGESDISRKAFKLREIVKQCQWGFTSIEKCAKPVIAAIQGGCIGGGMSLATASDIRYATEDCFFELKEVDIGMQADVGVLQRMPKYVSGDSLMRELAFTGRRLMADEALKIGLVSRLFSTYTELMEACMSLAETIASKSPVAVQGTKINLNYSRDHSVDAGLDFSANWNMCHLQSEDTIKSAMAAARKEQEPIAYSKL